MSVQYDASARARRELERGEAYDVLLAVLFATSARIGGMLGIALAYFLSLAYIGIEPLKALVIAAIVLCLMAANFGRRSLFRLGIALVVFAMGVWIEVLPSLDRWKFVVAKAFGAWTT